jgi:hypothetical protein
VKGGVVHLCKTSSTPFIPFSVDRKIPQGISRARANLGRSVDRYGEGIRAHTQRAAQAVGSAQANLYEVGINQSDTKLAEN